MLAAVICFPVDRQFPQRFEEGLRFQRRAYLPEDLPQFGIGVVHPMVCTNRNGEFVARFIRTLLPSNLSMVLAGEGFEMLFLAGVVVRWRPGGIAQEM